MDLRRVGDRTLVGLSHKREGFCHLWMGNFISTAQTEMYIFLHPKRVASELVLIQKVGLGDGMRGEHLTWRHTCSTLDFVNGNVKLFENGEKYFEKADVEDIREAYKANKKEIDIVTVG